MKYPLKQGLRWCMLSMAVSASAQVSAPVASTQLPTGGKVMSGTTSIQSVGNVLNINQSSQRSAINWNTFNVGSGAKVNFIQPSASSVTLNRVLDTNGSQIMGSISANGQVFISNPNGVLFGPNSQVNVGGLIATTQNISVDDFMAGKSTFEGTGAAGAVVNQGTLEAALGGYIALLAPSVRNEGVVLAREGTVAFAAGDKTVVQFNGPQLVTVMVDKPVLDALVENKQMVRADGGLVIFSARSANAVLSSVIRNTGTVQANSIVNRQGRIMLEGGSQGVVEVGGTLQASGVDAGTHGGTISATGDKVSVVSGALLDATGQAGGGNVLVGGGWQGSDPTIQSANAVNIASGAVLNASAIQNGEGGTVVAWSDMQNIAGVTKVQGTLLARGGAEGGNGGRIETSGRWISSEGAVGNASAPKGKGGQWLFDPYDIEIVESSNNPQSATGSTWTANVGNSQIINSDINNLLNSGTSVTISTGTSGSPGNGDITVSAPIARSIGTGPVGLTLVANNDINIKSTVNITGENSGLGLIAGNSIFFGGKVTANALFMDVTGTGSITQTQPIETKSLRINAPSSQITLNDNLNNFGVLAANVGSINLTSKEGYIFPDSPDSILVGPSTLVGSLTGSFNGSNTTLSGVTATGDVSISVLGGNLVLDKSVTTTGVNLSAPVLKLSSGGTLPPSINSGTYPANPYGPNIILTSDFLTNRESISIINGQQGRLYTGGYSGAYSSSLASYLGSNSSRYNSNEGTSNFFTPITSGLTAIYRQPAYLTYSPETITENYGSTQYSPDVSDTSKIIIPNIRIENSGVVNNDAITTPNASATANRNFSLSGFQKSGSYATSLPNDFLNNYMSSNVIRPLLFACGNNSCYNQMFNGLGYIVNTGTSSLNVTPAPLTLTYSPSAKTYGDPYSFTRSDFVVSGLKNSETITNAPLTSSGTANTAIVGYYPISLSSSLTGSGGFTQSNYTIASTSGSLNVTPAPLQIIANNGVKTYGDYIAFIGTEFKGVGFKNSEGAATRIALSSPGAINTAIAGEGYSITPSSLSGITTSNYAITYVPGNLTINKANATVTGLSGSTEFDGFTKTINGFTASGLVNGETTGDIARSVSNTNGISASVSGRFAGTYLNTPYGTANNYNLNYASGQLVITGCPGGPPCSAIGPQTTSSNITPVVIPAMTAPSFSSALVSTVAPTISSAPVLTFASSSGGSSFGSGGGSTTIANNSTTINSVTTTNVISSGNITTNTSPASFITTTTIVDTGINPTNPVTNVINIATNTSVGAPTQSQINVAQGNATTANTVNTTNNVNIQASAGTNQAPTNIASTQTTNTATSQPTNGVVAVNNPNATPVNVTTTQTNVVNPQKLADILSKKDTVEIATALPPNQVAQLSPEQVAPLVNSLNLRQLMSLTNEQIAKFDPVRQAELLNIIKVIKDNPEKAAEKAFTPTDKTFAQLAANGLLKEQIDTLSTRVTQINQNRTTVNIDTPQKLAELLTKKDPVEIATALPSNQVAQLTPEQAAPLINSLTVRQLLSLTNEQISKFDPTRQAELLNIINVIKNNPEKAADKAYTAIDKITAQYVANGLMKDQIDALASRVTQITQNKTTINLDGPQRLAEILNKNTTVEIAKALPSNLVPQLSSEQVAPLINTLSVKQLLALTNDQMSKLDPTRLAELLNIIKGLKDNPEKAIDKTYTPEDTAVAKYAATGLLKDPIERLSLRANYIAENKFKDPLGKELADLTNPPVPANVPAARNAPNQANRPLNAAQLAVQNANRETPNLTPAQVAALDPKDLGPLLSQLSANQLMAITNLQMARLEGAYLNQLTALLNFVQDRTSNPVASAVPNAGGNRVNNTNIFINQPVAKLAGAALLADQPNTAPLTAPVPPPATQLASVTLTPKQVSELDPAQLAPLINQLNANQLMAITNAQMARMDGRTLNQLTILMNFVQQRTANNNGTANSNNPANGGNNTNINVFVNQPVSRLASNALLNEQPKPNAPVGAQSFTQTNITVNLTPKQVSELDPTQLAPLISQLNANQLMAITNTQMARMDSQAINQLNILMNFVQQRALNSNTNTTIYINQPVSQIAAAFLMNDQPPPTQIAGAATAPIATVPLSPQQIAGLTPSQVAPLLNRMNSRQLMAVTDTQMASLDSANLNQLITLLNFIQDSARTSPIVTNNFANRPVAGFLPPELNTTQTVTQP